MESAEMEAIVRGKLAEVEAGIRKIVETARRRIKPMADAPDDGRRGIRHEVCDLTWLARELGVHLGRETVDLDDAYTEEYGETPAQTIRNQGEDEFRKKESAVAMRELSRSGIIISCGGGIVVREENHFPLKCNSTVIYNERPLDVLCLSNRPLSADNGVEKLYNSRKEKYESLADLVIKVGKKDTREQYLEEAVRIYDENTCT